MNGIVVQGHCSLMYVLHESDAPRDHCSKGSNLILYLKLFNTRTYSRQTSDNST